MAGPLVDAHGHIELGLAPGEQAVGIAHMARQAAGEMELGVVAGRITREQRLRAQAGQ